MNDEKRLEEIKARVTEGKIFVGDGAYMISRLEAQQAELQLKDEAIAMAYEKGLKILGYKLTEKVESTPAGYYDALTEARGKIEAQKAELAALRKAWRDSGGDMWMGEATIEQERELFTALDGIAGAWDASEPKESVVAAMSATEGKE